jgi:hypothetical protein
MNTQSFLRQIDVEMVVLKWRWKSAKVAYRKSECWKYEQETKTDFQSHKAPLPPGQQRRFRSYKPHLLRKDECLLKISQMMQVLAAWRRNPSQDFPLYCLACIERWFEVLQQERKRPRETAADVIRYNWRVVELVDGAYRKNNEASQRKRPLPWSEYRLFNAVANFIARYPREYKSKQFLKNGANSGSLKMPVKNAIADRGASFPSKARNKGRFSKQ